MLQIILNNIASRYFIVNSVKCLRNVTYTVVQFESIVLIHSMICYWHHRVCCSSVCPSVQSFVNA